MAYQFCFSGDGLGWTLACFHPPRSMHMAIMKCEEVLKEGSEVSSLGNVHTSCDHSEDIHLVGAAV